MAVEGGLQVDGGTEALEVLLQSPRVFDDLCLFQECGEAPALAADPPAKPTPPKPGPPKPPLPKPPPPRPPPANASSLFHRHPPVWLTDQPGGLLFHLQSFR